MAESAKLYGMVFACIFRNRVLVFVSTRNIYLDNFLCHVHKALEIRQKIS